MKCRPVAENPAFQAIFVNAIGPKANPGGVAIPLGAPLSQAGLPSGAGLARPSSTLSGRRTAARSPGPVEACTRLVASTISTPPASTIEKRRPALSQKFAVLRQNRRFYAG